MNTPRISKEKRDAGLIKARLCKTRRAQIKQSIKKGSADFNSFFAASVTVNSAFILGYFEASTLIIFIVWL